MNHNTESFLGLHYEKMRIKSLQINVECVLGF